MKQASIGAFEYVFRTSVLWIHCICSSSSTAMATLRMFQAYPSTSALLRLVSCGSTLSALHQHLQDFCGLGEELAALPALHTCMTPCRYFQGQAVGACATATSAPLQCELTSYPLCLCRTSRAC